MGVIHGNFKRIAMGSGVYHEIGGNVNGVTGRSIYHGLSRVTSGGGAVYFLSGAGRIACKDVGLFEASSCPLPPL
jgi:hypothetical protein